MTKRFADPAYASATGACLRREISESLPVSEHARRCCRACYGNPHLVQRIGKRRRSDVRLMSLDLLVKQAAQSLVTSPSDVVHLLENTQSVMKRLGVGGERKAQGCRPREVVDRQRVPCTVRPLGGALPHIRSSHLLTDNLHGRLPFG